MSDERVITAGGALPAGAPEPLSVSLDTFLDAIRTGELDESAV